MPRRSRVSTTPRRSTRRTAAGSTCAASSPAIYAERRRARELRSGAGDRQGLICRFSIDCPDTLIDLGGRQEGARKLLEGTTREHPTRPWRSPCSARSTLRLKRHRRLSRTSWRRCGSNRRRNQLYKPLAESYAALRQRAGGQGCRSEDRQRVAAARRDPIVLGLCWRQTGRAVTLPPQHGAAASAVAGRIPAARTPVADCRLANHPGDIDATGAGGADGSVGRQHGHRERGGRRGRSGSRRTMRRCVARARYRPRITPRPTTRPMRSHQRAVRADPETRRSRTCRPAMPRCGARAGAAAADHRPARHAAAERRRSAGATRCGRSRTASVRERWRMSAARRQRQ